MVELFRLPVIGAPRLIAIGDSITARADTVSGNNTDRQLLGYLTWVNILTRHRFHCPPEYNFGISGDATANVVARLTTILAAQPNVAIVHIGTNDIANGATYATTIANLTTIYDALASIGCVIVAVPITGRSTPNTLASDAVRQKGLAINEWIRRNARTRLGFYVADCGLVFDDPTSAAWADRSGVTVDGLHSSTNGAYILGNRITTILTTLYPDWLLPYSNRLDTYDVTNNPSGSILTNGDMNGSTAAGVASGNIATGWTDTFSALNGATAAYSKVTLADGRNAVQLDLSGNMNGSNGMVLLNGTVAFASVSAGDNIQASVDVSIGANSGIVACQISLQATISSVLKFAREGTYDGAYVIPTAGFSGTLMTPKLPCPAGPTTAALILRVGLKDVGISTAVSGTIQWASAAVRKVA